MQVDLPETTSKIGGPLVRQFSVFLPNKVGAMLEVVKLLNAHATHVVALSVSESTDAAIARIIVSDPERVEELFRENNVAFGVCELMVVELREVATQFIKILATLLMAEVNVHFSYPLLTRPNCRDVLAMHVDDSECAASVLQGEGFRLLSQRDISRCIFTGGTRRGESRTRRNALIKTPSSFAFRHSSLGFRSGLGWAPPRRPD